MQFPEERLFEQALAVPQGPARTEFLRTACHGDLQLELRVAQLLAAHESAASILDAPATEPLLQLLSDTPADACGEFVGPYKLLELIGEGGMGLVYMAEQEQPIRRRVAVKIIKPGMDTRQVLARFEAERRALERLDHPGIARILDAGITPAGRPYFVMELVRGISIAEFCDQAQLGTRERLELFIRVCQAVHYAHEAGIIHRDLKPANILVTLHDGVPVPKIIDFGIAKATSGRLVDQTLFTNFLQMIGTPVYMSPEQAQLTSQDVDARSDVYSLGVVLYELLTGTTPFAHERLREAGYPELQRIIREEEPPTPSSRVATLSGAELSTIATRRGIEPRRYAHALRGDLDWIVMRALEKDPRRRYPSAADVAQDVLRYLDHQPIRARRPTLIYRARKLARRRRGPLTAFIVILIAAGLMLAALNVAQHAEQQSRDLAERHAAEVRQREDSARQLSYAADIQRSWEAFQRGRLDEMGKLLAAHRPGPGQSDHRGFEWQYLWGLCQARPRVLREHLYDVYHVAWSSDGQYMATASVDRTVIVRDGQSGEPVAKLTGFQRDVNSTAFNHDGTIIGVAEEAGVVSLWNWRDGRQVAHLSGFDYPVAALVFTADPDVVVVTDVRWGSNDANTSVWRISTGERIAQRPQTRLLAYDRRRQRILTRSDVHELEFRSPFDLQGEQAVGRDNGLIEFAALSPDGARLATCSATGIVACWEIGAECRKLFETAAVTRGRSVAYSPDGRQFAACGDDGAVRVWDARTFQLQHALWTAPGRAWFCSFSPDGQQLVVTRDRGTVEVYQTADLHPATRLIHQVDSGQHVWACDPARNLVADAVVGREVVELFSLQERRQIGRYVLSPAAPITALAFRPNGAALWVGCSTGRLVELDLDSGSERRSLMTTPGLTTFVLSPDGAWIGAAPDMTVWDVEALQRRLTLEKSRDDPYQCFYEALDPQRVMVRILGGGGIDIQDVNTGRRIGPQFRIHGGVAAVAATPDRSLLAIGTSERAIHLWDPLTGRDRHVLFGHASTPNRVAFSPDGRTLASLAGGNLRLWHVATGQQLLQLDLLYGGGGLLEFSRDGRQLLVAGPAVPPLPNQSDGPEGLLILEAPPLRQAIPLPSRAVAPE